MKTLVVGARGMLGTEVMAALSVRGQLCRGVDVDELDITDAGAVERMFGDEEPELVINCAAFTAVDRAEMEEELASSVNGVGPGLLATYARALNASVVHFSTDFVFDGESGRPYAVDDPPRPLSAYGRSKLQGERAVQASGANHLIVRTSWLYGAAGPNFVSAILAKSRRGEPLRIVGDQWGRPTWARNLADVTLSLVDASARGIFHASDGGPATSWFSFGKKVLELSGGSVPVDEVSGDEWGAPAARPAYSVLDLSPTEALLGRSLEPWDVALARFLETVDS